MSPQAENRGRWLDRGAGLVVWLGVFSYLAAMPRNLGVAEQSYFLLEAKRILQGEVLYEDVFYWSTPAAHWIMALAFRVFGTDIQTAKLVMAALHGLTGVVAFLAARRLGVRRGLALCVPLAYVALCQAAWPHASPHWFSSFLVVLLLFLMIDDAWTRGGAAAAVVGVVVGVLVSIQHHRGGAVAVGLCGLFVLEAVLASGSRDERPRRSVVTRLSCFAGGIAAVVVPVVLVVVANAGWQAFLDPILWGTSGGPYRGYEYTGWGAVAPMSIGYARYTLPLAPVFLVFCAETLEVAMEGVASRTGHRTSFAVLVSGLACLLGVQLHANVVHAHHQYRHPHDTAFGRVDYESQEEIRLVERVRALLAEAGSRDSLRIPCIPRCT